MLRAFYLWSHLSHRLTRVWTMLTKQPQLFQTSTLDCVEVKLRSVRYNVFKSLAGGKFKIVTDVTYQQLYFHLVVIKPSSQLLVHVVFRPISNLLELPVHSVSTRVAEAKQKNRVPSPWEQRGRSYAGIDPRTSQLRGGVFSTTRRSLMSSETFPEGRVSQFQEQVKKQTQIKQRSNKVACDQWSGTRSIVVQ